MDDTVESLKAALAVEKPVASCVGLGWHRAMADALAAAQKRIEALEAERDEARAANDSITEAADKLAARIVELEAINNMELTETGAQALASPSESAPQPTPDPAAAPASAPQGLFGEGLARLRETLAAYVAWSGHDEPWRKVREQIVYRVAECDVASNGDLPVVLDGIDPKLADFIVAAYDIARALPLPESALLKKAAPLAGAPTLTDAERAVAGDFVAFQRMCNPAVGVSLKPSAPVPVLGRCYGHLGPPSNTNEPHPENGSCFDWRADPCPEKQSHPAAPAPVETRLNKEES